MHEKSYFFKDFGPGDFFGEIECFAGLPRYRISILSSTKCRLLAIPSIYYMEWMRMDVDFYVNGLSKLMFKEGITCM